MFESKTSTFSQIKLVLHQQKLKYRNLPPLKRLALLLVFGVVIILLFKLLVYVFITDLSYHTEHTKCPACFGTRICKRIRETSVYGKEKLHHINSFTNVKNVYYGDVNGVKLVFKKLAHDDELDQIDRYICEGGLTDCRPSYDNHRLCIESQVTDKRCPFSESINELINSLESKITPTLVKGFNDAFACPSPRLIKHMVNRYQERGIFRYSDGLSKVEMFMFLYTMAVNQEPIIYQSFPAGEGWPFPPYVGACGRIVATEYSGKPLRNYFQADWNTRLRLSLQLLKIADHLTDNALGFTLYFTDVSLDNYVVDDLSLKVVIADAENIIIADEQYLSVERPAGYKELHVNPFDKCPGQTNCLTIDIDSLCSHSKSDFNYYAVCRSLLSSYAQDEQGDGGGLLHSPPPNNLTAAAIVKLADECAKPSEGKNRVQIKEDLIYALKSALGLKQ